MDSDPACLITMVLDVSARTHRAAGIEQFVPERYESLLGRASSLLHRYRIGDPAFGADDAVQAALLKVVQGIKDGHVSSTATDEDLLKLLRHELNQRISSERERGQTRKRGGSNRADDNMYEPFRHVDIDLETIGSNHPAPDANLGVEDQVKWHLDILDIHDSRLRVVASMKADGFTHKEIAAHLDQPVSAIERWTRLMRSIAERRCPDFFEK